jgi:glycine/D-amino acid oxidase-like deaminating enzyme
MSTDVSNSDLYDVIVIGGGIMGSWSAVQSIRNGAKNVLLIEKVRLYSLFVVQNSEFWNSRVFPTVSIAAYERKFSWRNKNMQIRVSSATSNYFG